MVQPYSLQYLVGAQLDPPLIPRSLVPYPLQGDFCVLIALQARELLSPLDQENAVFGDQVIEAEGLKLARRVYPIEINVIDVDFRPAILMHQSEGWASDVVGGSSMESLGNAFDQGGLARTQFTTQKDQLGRSKHGSKLAA